MSLFYIHIYIYKRRERERKRKWASKYFLFIRPICFHIYLCMCWNIFKFCIYVCFCDKDEEKNV